MAVCFVSRRPGQFLRWAYREPQWKLESRQPQLLQGDENADESEKDGNNSEYHRYNCRGIHFSFKSHRDGNSCGMTELQILPREVRTASHFKGFKESAWPSLTDGRQFNVCYGYLQDNAPSRKMISFSCLHHSGSASRPQCQYYIQTQTVKGKRRISERNMKHQKAVEPAAIE